MNNQPFDLTSVLAQAAQVTQQQEENSNGGMKLIYPQSGTLKVRLLYNNAAGVVMRKFERHTINKQKITCLQNYGMDCPICKMIDNIQNATGADLWQMKRTTRGIAYAEYIDSDYKWDDPKNAPSKGEIVILMFPWTIYTDLNRLISSAGQNIYSLIASNVGGVFKISRWSENKQIKYRAEIDPFDQQHQTRGSEEEFQKLLMDLPSLNDKFVPIEPNDNIIKAAQSMADELNNEYLAPRVQQPSFGQTGMNLSAMAGGVVNQTTETVNTVKNLFDSKATFDTRSGTYVSNKAYRPIGDPIFNPTRNGKGAVTHENIGGDFQVRDIVDIDYFKNKLFSGLKIPKALLGYEESLPGGLGDNTLTRLDIRYSRSVKRVQNALIVGVKDLCNIWLRLNGREADTSNFKVVLQAPSTAEELGRLTEFSTKMGTISEIVSTLSNTYGEYINIPKVFKVFFDKYINYPDLVEGIDPELNSAIEKYEQHLKDEEARRKAEIEAMKNPTNPDNIDDNSDTEDYEE